MTVGRLRSSRNPEAGRLPHDWRGALPFVLLVLLLAALPAAAQPTLRLVPDLAMSDTSGWYLATDGVQMPRHGFVSTVLAESTAAHVNRNRGKLRLDLDTIVLNFSDLAEEYGLPLQPYEARSRKRLAGVSASYRPRDDMPAIRFAVGDQGPEPFAAFSSPREDYSWSIVLPLDNFRVGIQSGDDSVFGYYAIGGVQWTAPDDTFSAGLGIPVHLRNAEGDAGLLLMFRLKLP